MQVSSLWQADIWRRAWARLLVVALLLAPALMHSDLARAALHGGHGAQTAAASSTEHHHGHCAGDQAGPATPAETSGACVFCVICGGAPAIAPGPGLTPALAETTPPAPAPALAARAPEPGVRPPLR